MARTQVAQVRFRDDPTDVAGKTYEFRQGGAGRIWRSGNFLMRRISPVVERRWVFCRTGRRDPWSRCWPRTSRPPDRGACRADGAVELLEVARIIGLQAGDDSAETAGNLQRLVVDYFSETLPKAAGTATGGDPEEQLSIPSYDCLAASARHAGRPTGPTTLRSRLPRPGARSLSTTWHAGDVPRHGCRRLYRFDEFSQNFTGSPAMLAEARSSRRSPRRCGRVPGRPRTRKCCAKFMTATSAGRPRFPRRSGRRRAGGCAVAL